MPGTLAGMVRIMVREVYFATSAGLAVGASRPGRHMLGLSRMPSCWGRGLWGGGVCVSVWAWACVCARRGGAAPPRSPLKHSVRNQP